MIYLSFLINIKGYASETNEERLLCDEIVTKCELMINQYKNLSEINDNYIDFLNKELEKERKKPVVEWYMWLLIGIGTGAALSK